MDSPLNWAHLQERKAESFLSCHQFSEAIKCYQKAAEFLLEAMKLTRATQIFEKRKKSATEKSLPRAQWTGSKVVYDVNSGTFIKRFTKALSSMQLQYENNLRQEKVLNEKWRRHDLHQERIRQEKERVKRELQENNFQKKPQSLSSDLVDKRKKAEHLDTSSCSLVISAENFSVSSLSSSTELLASKDDKDEVSELRAQLRDLQMQQLSLTQALEDSNRENTKLKKTILVLKGILKSKLNLDFDENLMVKGDDENSRVEEIELDHVTESTKSLS